MTDKKFAFIERAIRRSLNETNEINRVETEQDAFDMVDAAIDEHQRSKLYKVVNAKSSYAFDKLYLMSDRLGAEHQHFADLEMQDKWLQKVIDKHRCSDTVKEAQKVLQNRLNQEIATTATQSCNDRLNSGSLNKPTAQQGGFSLSVGSKKQAVKATKQASMDM